MFFRKNIVIIVLCIIVSCSSFAQDSEFYDALITIMHDAPNQFRNIKGLPISDNMFALIWHCGIKLPGTIDSRFVYAKGTFYEGALLQTNNIAELRINYDRYIALLDSCVKPLGYSKSLSDNFSPGISEFKKVAFLPDIKPGMQLENAPPHLAIEVAYIKSKELYTLMLFIYEH